MSRIAVEPQTLVEALSTCHRRPRVEADAPASSGARLIDAVSDERLTDAATAGSSRNAEHPDRGRLWVLDLTQLCLSDRKRDASDDNSAHLGDDHIARLD